ncbi:hypothetical protein [Mycolicibacterium komossense]|uniref:hypothetical protein n=1 Tax=Mycolicibacterium komossense TaxID=1779 RepID=UPI0021F3575F|nr:hypothetical protein [Mycolicibacterium komossense]
MVVADFLQGGTIASVYAESPGQDVVFTVIAGKAAEHRQHQVVDRGDIAGQLIEPDTELIDVRGMYQRRRRQRTKVSHSSNECDRFGWPRLIAECQA